MILTKFKVGNKVKTPYGVGKILYIDDSGFRYCPCLVGIKGRNCYDLEDFLTIEEMQKYVIDKGYEGQCEWFYENELELIEEE